MTWHDAIDIEIVCEVKPYRPNAWDALEDALWFGNGVMYWKDREYRAWWRQSKIGRQHQARMLAKRYAILRDTIVAYRACVVCKSMFAVSASAYEQRRGRVCSAACIAKVPRRTNKVVRAAIGAVTQADAARAAGVSQAAIAGRIARGWSPEDVARPSDRTGENNAQAKLTAEVVMSIRQAWSDGESIKSLARRIGAGVSTIRSAVRGETWKHLPMPTRPA